MVLVSRIAQKAGVLHGFRARRGVDFKRTSKRLQSGAFLKITRRSHQDGNEIGHDEGKMAQHAKIKHSKSNRFLAVLKLVFSLGFKSNLNTRCFVHFIKIVFFQTDVLNDVFFTKMLQTLHVL